MTATPTATNPMTTTTTLTDGHPATALLPNLARVECGPAIDPDVVNEALEAHHGQGAFVELGREGRVRFLTVRGDGEAMTAAAFHFVAGFLSALRAD